MTGVGLGTKSNLFGTSENRKILIVYGVFAFLLIVFQLISIKFIDPSEAMALFQCQIVIVPIIARFILNEKFRIIFILSLIISILGVIFITQHS